MTPYEKSILQAAFVLVIIKATYFSDAVDGETRCAIAEVLYVYVCSHFRSCHEIAGPIQRNPAGSHSRAFEIDHGVLPGKRNGTGLAQAREIFALFGG
jgi:hypothetical protein